MSQDCLPGLWCCPPTVFSTGKCAAILNPHSNYFTVPMLLVYDEPEAHNGLSLALLQQHRTRWSFSLPPSLLPNRHPTMCHTALPCFHPRPWMRRITWLLFVLVSVVSMALGKSMRMQMLSAHIGRPGVTAFGEPSEAMSFFQPCKAAAVFATAASTRALFGGRSILAMRLHP